jgi:hypothetical protein
MKLGNRVLDDIENLETVVVFDAPKYPFR